MAIRMVRMDERVRYVSDQDPAKGTDREDMDATVFVLRPLSSRVMSAIKDKATNFRRDPASQEDDPEMIAEFRPNECNYLTAQYGLAGIERLVGPDGNEAAFQTVRKSLGGVEYDVASPKILDLLPLEVLREIGERVEALSTPSEADLGKSGGSS